MSRVELRLLGGFEVRLGDSPVEGFESRKSRALLAYLALHRDRASERRMLASLLWSERPERSARRNLRQALHDLRRTLAGNGVVRGLFHGERGTVRLNPELDCWIDVEAFRQAVQAGSDGDPLALAAAARLYGGDLLAGFALSDSPLFEEWLEAERRRLRQAAVGALDRLLAEALATGDHVIGIDYAHRLLAVEPLLEDAHRQLMRLYAAAGRPGRALAHYERLCELLDRDLGVEPQPETVALQRELLAARAGGASAAEDTARIEVAPRLPLVGRSTELARLTEAWRAARRRGAGLTLLIGVPGIGKTRLARTFLDRLNRDGASAIRTAAMRPGAGERSLAELIDEAPRRPELSILFVDEVDPTGRAELQRTAERLEARRHEAPLWVLAACRKTPAPGPLGDVPLERIRLGRLDRAAVGEICRSLLGRRQAARLTGPLHAAGGGLPLMLAEIIGYLWDEGHLVAEAEAGWRLAGDPPPELPNDLDDLVRRRLARLPTSARRLLVAAAALGSPFDRSTLIRTEGEHPAVVDACLEVLLDRWWVRWADPAWSSEPPLSDAERWSHGGRNAPLELGHERLRRAVLASLDAERRRALRRRAAAAEVRTAGGTSASGRGSRA